MIYVTLPTTTEEKRLTYYLAMEEYVARHMESDDYFFMWQVTPTVIFGRNQLIQSEVNLEYCRTHGINTFRRKSGGGCVYADKSNIMFSYITHNENVNLTFSKYIGMVVEMLRKLGVPATASGRNDIMIGDRKVSGNAFYHIPGRSIVHGTMLYDTNMQNMVGAITPSDEKLVSKGINSVRQHITLLKDHIEMDIEAFKTFVKNDLCSREVVLDEAAMNEISRIEEEYLDPEFIYGNNPRYNIQRQGRIEGVGDFVVNIEMKNDVIKDVDIKGDYFLVGDIGQQVIAPLINRHLTKEDLEAALPDRLNDVILNMKKADFVGLLLNK
ncbi:MAG: lipoate protein ligase C-terminal domain-containing protein [Prevotella sp.]|nr:lipoate protein ligase C-terminal domain-containing protein [Prevotella sp.]